MANYDPDTELLEAKLPCPECGSSDAFAIYSDGHGFCHSGNHPSETKTYSAARLEALGYCHRVEGAASVVSHSRAGTVRTPQNSELEKELTTGKPKAIGSRKLTLQTAKKWDYLCRTKKDGTMQELAPFRDASGTLVGVKIRDRGKDGMGKDFFALGKVTGHLFGRHLWGQGQKRTDGRPSWVLITEGEHDAMAASQAFDHKYPIVSVPGGVDSAEGAVKANLEWLLTFDRVIFGFDQDEPGREAMEECCKLLPPGRAFEAIWVGGKDASELLQADKSVDITKAVWNPNPYRPDGVVDARNLTAACMEEVPMGMPWPWEGMTAISFGRRPAEAHELGAGTGVGKTDIIAAIIACTISGKTQYGETFPPEPVALFSYESEASTSKKAIASKLAHRLFHLPKAFCPAGFEWTDEELAAVLHEMDTTLWNAGGRLFINDSFGAADWEDVKSRWRFLAKAEGVKHFVLDPVGAMALGQDDERKILDKVSLEFTSLMVELNATGYLAAHLNRPEGASHEEGGRVSLRNFRGSNGLVMYLPFIWGLERNSQAEDVTERMTTTVRALKLRPFGFNVGKTFSLHYDTFTGQLTEPASNKDTQL